MSDDKKKKSTPKWVWAMAIVLPIALSCFIYGLTSKTPPPKPLENILPEFVPAGTWSNYYGPGQLRSVSGAYDRKWQLTTRDYFTKKETEKEPEDLPPGPIITPDNMVRVRFGSQKYDLKIEYVLPEPPKQ